MITVRAANSDDVDAWRVLRRHGIQRFPAAFRLSLAEHDAITPKADAAQLAKGCRFLAFQDNQAVGSIGLYQHEQPNTAHRSEVFGMYVKPEIQGTNAASSLMQAIFDAAPSLGIWQLELTVNEANARAIAFYQRHGFSRAGRIPNAILGADGPEHDLTYVLTREPPHQTT